MDTLRNASDELRDRHVLDFDPNAVTSIALSAPNQPELDLQRLESAAGGQIAGWQIIRRGGGAPGPQTLPADSGGRPAAPRAARDPDRAQVPERRPDQRRPRGLGVQPPGARDHPHARRGGDHAGDAADRTPHEPRERRLRADRGLVLGLRRGARHPARDRRVAARLARAAAQRHPRVGPHHFAHPGQRRGRLGHLRAQARRRRDLGRRRSPRSRRPRKAALGALLSQLRLLRAASFVQDGFPEKVFAAGEVRPWRYRLDATVSLPGGAGRRAGQHDDALVRRADRRRRSSSRARRISGPCSRSSSRCWTPSGR